MNYLILVLMGLSAIGLPQEANPPKELFSSNPAGKYSFSLSEQNGGLVVQVSLGAYVSENAPKAVQSSTPDTYKVAEEIRIWILRKDGTALKQIKPPIEWGTGNEWVTAMSRSFFFEYVAPRELSGVIIGADSELLTTELKLDSN